MADSAGEGRLPPVRRRAARRNAPIQFPVGEVLSRSFATFAKQAFVLLPLAALFYALPTWLQMLQMEAIKEAFRGATLMPSWYDRLGGGVGMAAMLALWVLPLGFQAVVTYAVFQSLRGTSIRYGPSFAIGLSRLPHAFGASLLVVLAVIVPASILVAFVAGGMRVQPVWVAAIPAFAFVGWIFSRLFVSIQAAVVETAGPFRALSRSSFLTHGARMRVFAVILVTHLIPYGIAHLAQQLQISSWDGESDLSTQIILVGAGLAVLFAGLQAVAAAVTYHALRSAKEGVGLNELLAVFD